MAKKGKRIICLILSCYLMFFSCPKIHANESVATVLESTATIADIVMSYYYISGSAVADVDWINILYDSLGSSFGTLSDFVTNGYLVQNAEGYFEPVQAFENAIEQTAAYADLGLSDIFNVSAQEVAAGGGAVVATGAGTLAGAAGCTASVGVLPILGGVTAAYWGGIALGTLIAHKIGLYGETIKNGARISDTDFINSLNLPAGSCVAFYGYGRNGVFWEDHCTVYSSGSTIFVGYYDGYAYTGYNFTKGSPNQVITVTDYNRINNNVSTGTITLNI